MKIEMEIMRGCWEEVELDQLTDDQEETPTTEDPSLLDGSSWYLDGDYTVAPRPVRVIGESRNE